MNNSHIVQTRSCLSHDEVAVDLGLAVEIGTSPLFVACLIVAKVHDVSDRGNDLCSGIAVGGDEAVVGL